jgi:hypothetical protein
LDRGATSRQRVERADGGSAPEKNTGDLQWKMRANYNARPCDGERKAAGAETMKNNGKTMKKQCAEQWRQSEIRARADVRFDRGRQATMLRASRCQTDRVRWRNMRQVRFGAPVKYRRFTGNLQGIGFHFFPWRRSDRVRSAAARTDSPLAEPWDCSLISEVVPRLLSCKLQGICRDAYDLSRSATGRDAADRALPGGHEKTRRSQRRATTRKNPRLGFQPSPILRANASKRKKRSRYSR